MECSPLVTIRHYSVPFQRVSLDIEFLPHSEVSLCLYLKCFAYFLVFSTSASLCVIVKVIGGTTRQLADVTATEQVKLSKPDLRISGILGSSVITIWWKMATSRHFILFFSESSACALSHPSTVWHWFKGALWPLSSARREQRLFNRVWWDAEKVSITFCRICGRICGESAGKSVQ